MPKDENELNKRQLIISTALKMFFNNGFEGTSVRGIMKNVGAEIGLFYYYFISKDEVFYIAVEKFIESYRPGFDEAYEKGVQEPRMALSIFFEYVNQSTIKFREQYSDKLHWTIRLAIREKALEIIEPYLEKILNLLIEKGLKKPEVDIKVLSVMLTHGVGSVILHSDTEMYQRSFPEMKKAVHLLLGSPE